MLDWVRDIPLIPYQHPVCRMVETQEEAATMSLVDDLEQQSLLESILDEFKPAYREGTQQRHYLISTPFRYPPLRYGSRWGSRAERSFFYASEDERTCLFEAAFYRFAFCEGKATPFSKPLRSEHCLFYVDVQTDSCSDTTQISSDIETARLRDPISYSATQQAGALLRGRGVEVIRYYSARCENGVNVAIDNPDCIVSEVPKNEVAITCEIDSQQGIVRFAKRRDFPVSFTRTAFLVDGAFPVLA